jgi:hypothetical protein
MTAFITINKIAATTAMAGSLGLAALGFGSGTAAADTSSDSGNNTSSSSTSGRSSGSGSASPSGKPTASGTDATSDTGAPGTSPRRNRGAAADNDAAAGVPSESGRLSGPTVRVGSAPTSGVSHSGGALTSATYTDGASGVSAPASATTTYSPNGPFLLQPPLEAEGPVEIVDPRHVETDEERAKRLAHEEAQRTALAAKTASAVAGGMMGVFFPPAWAFAASAGGAAATQMASGGGPN